MAARPKREVSDKDVAVLLGMYRQFDAQIAQHEVDIRGLEHKQAIVVQAMNDLGLTYREIGPLIHRSSSRAHQIAETLKS